MVERSLDQVRKTVSLRDQFLAAEKNYRVSSFATTARLGLADRGADTLARPNSRTGSEPCSCSCAIYPFLHTNQEEILPCKHR